MCAVETLVSRPNVQAGRAHRHCLRLQQWHRPVQRLHPGGVVIGAVEQARQCMQLAHVSVSDFRQADQLVGIGISCVLAAVLE
jgi:hypothetical protein